MQIDPEVWASEEFSQCQLGDARRTRRLVKAAAQTLARPDGSTPEQTECWAECKALYRLMDCDEISFESITAPHYERTRSHGQPGNVWLILNDTTEINYGRHRQASGLGWVGKNTARGFFLHSALMRDPDSRAIVGLAGQELSFRFTKRRGAKNSRRRDPQRESAVWGRLIDQVGRPPEGVTWLHVCDRGADDYEVYLRAARQGCGWIVRACRLNRLIENSEQQTLSLAEHLAQQPVQGHVLHPVQATSCSPAREAKLALRFASLRMPVPRVQNAWIRQHAPASGLKMHVIELREIDPPAGATPLHWVLLTSEPIDTLADAQRCLDYYAQRWAIEEYHKALKTGCRVEARYYETSDRLQRVTAMLSIVAVQLLRLRSLADENPHALARQVVPVEWVEVLAEVRPRKLSPARMTLAEFVRQLAGLGGHLGRKHDGRPGWITLWRGLEKLLLILRGVRTTREKCG